MALFTSCRSVYLWWVALLSMFQPDDKQGRFPTGCCCRTCDTPAPFQSVLPPLASPHHHTAPTRHAGGRVRPEKPLRLYKAPVTLPDWWNGWKPNKVCWNKFVFYMVTIRHICYMSSYVRLMLCSISHPNNNERGFLYWFCPLYQSGKCDRGFTVKLDLPISWHMRVILSNWALNIWFPHYDADN